MTRQDPPQGTQLISRAADVLRAIPRGMPGGRRLRDIALSTGLAEPTTRRILMALIYEGFVVQDAQGRLYRLGPLAYELGLASNFHGEVVELCLPHVRALSADTGMTAILGMRARWEAVALSHAEGEEKILSRIVDAGERLPLGVGTGGVALLAALSDAEIDEILSAPQYALWPISREEILARVAFARAHGYADIVDKPLQGLRGIAVVVATHKASPSLYLALVSTRERLRNEKLSQTVSILRMTADRIGAALDLR
ncbi:IclR family transcriptional regulator [Tianweitania sediminis]|uniref:Helix-turn-helix domain-containing protein n=1 Tax=Tianweitania sediminis TaxID=1502156 RepID=A0A8J7RHL2_9HYPH|nr:helix-turn-helix domain-containing protein [Tianweitania sediminis]MBP0437361.1 helix-turn-helix domain-containing protein [Tianweitania sediminis]